MFYSWCDVGVFCLHVNRLVFVLSTQVDHLEVVNKQYVKVIPAHGVNSDVVSGMKMQFRPLVFIMLRSHKHDRRLNLKMLRRNNISSLCHFL